MSDVGVMVNGESRRVAAGTTLAALVGAIAGELRGVAVAVDREVVPRSSWEKVLVREGSSIEVVTAAAGG